MTLNPNTSLHFRPIKIKYTINNNNNSRNSRNSKQSNKKFKEISSKDVSKYQNSIKVICKRDAQDKHVVSDNMPCLCQYFATELGLRDKASQLDVKGRDDDCDAKVNTNAINSEKGDVISGEVSASELANCKAEIRSLQRDLLSFKISEENMEILMKRMIGEQRFLVAEIIDLRKINEEMKMQQTVDRNNQTLERSALLTELYEIKIHLQERSNFVEKILQQNEELTVALKDANEKIYTMGMKYLKLRSHIETNPIGNPSNEEQDNDAESSASNEIH